MIQNASGGQKNPNWEGVVRYVVADHLLCFFFLIYGAQVNKILEQHGSCFQADIRRLMMRISDVLLDYFDTVELQQKSMDVAATLTEFGMLGATIRATYEVHITSALLPGVESRLQELLSSCVERIRFPPPPITDAYAF